jgi:hypothetical protein
MVQLMNPQLLAAVTDNPGFGLIADGADRRPTAVLDTLHR